MKKEKRFKVKYYIDYIYLIEEVEETKTKFKYNLVEDKPLLFKTRFKINAKRDYDIEIRAFDLYYLRKFGWL